MFTGTERRVGEERRSAATRVRERRQMTKPVSVDRRSGEERRVGERRSGKDRRRT